MVFIILYITLQSNFRVSGQLGSLLRQRPLYIIRDNLAIILLKGHFYNSNKSFVLIDFILFIFHNNLFCNVYIWDHLWSSTMLSSGAED
ncbi:MAG: hypothetical protein UX58_C0003G0025 [Candidatus Wolfebacteria bacterium GW2011_GWB2_46_69]|nr:MAG: hypothetical protein UX58_C0003G0025 [Candidatus Wolfebacteria bacterium GW2011_GWB2_46_69]KKU53729.1 MAG: hypothetical protein UX76_C0011G0074 [Candidatus Wolfebacteria bacterium GW2011_GWC1_47_103]KKU59310.1 MAG: hypothetical protein UX83_C0006G0080 [Candidatus Wolfebacteria bacterium GW2011_GWE2_47_12]